MTKYAFFYENTCHAIAESDEEKNSLLKVNVDSVVKELTDTQFNDAKNLKTSLSLEGETVQETTWYSEDTPLLNDADVDSTTAKEQIKGLIDNLFKLNQVDVDSMNFPLSVETFQEWFNSQSGYPKKSILQLS